jgi:hypothetical protein
LVVHKSTPTQEKGLQPWPTYASKYTCNNSKRPSLRELIEEQVKITNNLSKKLLTVQNRAQVHRKPTGDLVPFHQGGSSLDLSIQGSKQTTKVLYLTYWSNPMWSVDRLNIHERMYGCGPGASQWSMDDRSLVMSDWQRVLDWLLA